MGHTMTTGFDDAERLRAELIREYEPYVCSVSALTKTPLEVAREAFHTCICRMLAGLQKQYAGKPITRWRRYIIRSAINEIKESGRRAHRLKTKVLAFAQLNEEERREVFRRAAPEATPLEQAARKELAALAWRELDNLSARQRQVVKGRCYDKTYKQIAADLGIDPGTARVHYHTALIELRRRLRVVA